MAITDFLNQVCNVNVQGAAQGRSGSPVRQPYTPVYQGLSCLVREMGGSNDPRNGKASQTSIVRIYLDPSEMDPGFRLTTKHQIQELDRPGGTPIRTFVVTAVVNPNSLGELLQVDVTEQPV